MAERSKDTTEDAALVERYLGTFLAWAKENSPNGAIADNARRAAEEMLRTERERCRDRPIRV